MNVLVLDGNQNQAVASVRSLARAGHTVRVGESTSWSKAGWSRDASGSFTYPAPQRDAAAFVQRIAQEVRRVGGALVLPMTERTTLPLSAHRGVVEEAGGTLVLPAHETVLRAFDKRATTALAESLGIRVPRTVEVKSAAEAARQAELVSYPVVLKPRSSEEERGGRVRATGAPVYARDTAEFAAAFAELRERCSAVLVQEYVEGAGAGYFALMHHGELRAEFAHRRIRDVRPTGSGSAVRASVQPDPRLREAGLAVLGALGWHGVAMVEFRLPPDGPPAFLEVNGRFWNSLPLAIYAGVDFPALLARMAEHGDIPPAPGYAEGVRCRWLLGDVRHLLEVMRGPPEGYAGYFPSRLRTLRDVLTPVPGTFHDNFMLRDPLPELGDWLDFAFRKLPGALKRRKEADA